MNRKLIVTLLQKDIRELNMITEGFMEMTEYPKAIIALAKSKVEDIQSHLQQLSDQHSDTITAHTYEPEQITEQAEEDELVVESTETAIDLNQETADIETIETVEVIETIETPEITEITEVSQFTEHTEITEDIEYTESKIEIQQPLTEISNVSNEISTTVIKETRITTEDTRKTILGERTITQTQSRNESLSKTDNSLSASIANKKISDIKQAISIGDRFRFQRELFRGNGEEMNKTMNYINQLATFDEVKIFLQAKYGWEINNEAAEDFYQIAKRRFI